MLDTSAQIAEGVGFVILVLIALMLPLASSIWAFIDAEERGKSGCLVAILVFFLIWPLGLLLWLVYRPKPRNPTYRGW